MTARHDRAAPAGTGRGAETEHGQALRIHSTTGHEALLNRLSNDGGDTAALALRALHAESPTLADPVLEAISHYTDEIDELLLSLGDAAVRSVAA